MSAWCTNVGACTAVSAAIDLSGVSNPHLFFQGYVDTATGSTYDGCAVFASPDNIDWYILSVTPAYDGQIYGGIGAWSGDRSSWQPYSADISFLGGVSTAYLRFDSGQNSSVGNNPGCYFDDLEIGHY